MAKLGDGIKELYYSLGMQNRATAPEVAIIGSGFGFHHLLPAILSIDNYRIFLMKPRNYSTSKYHKFMLPNITFCSLDEIISRNSIKIVFIAVPPFLQVEFVKRIAPTGKTIYLEKPCGLNYLEAVRIQQLSQEFGNNLYVGFQFRFDPVMLFTMDYLNTSVGQTIEYAKVNWNIKKKLANSSWKQNLALGGGVYRDHLCHIVDLLRCNFGFADESFLFRTDSQVEGANLLDQVFVNSKNLQIEINRQFHSNSSLKMEFVTPENVVLVESHFPFRLGDYTLSKNGQTVNLPTSIDLDQDARRYSLSSYFHSIFIEEDSKRTQDNGFNFARIEDAIFTQKISDSIGASNR